MKSKAIQLATAKFPNQKEQIETVVDFADKTIAGKNETDAPDILKKLGVTPKAINEIFNKYGNRLTTKGFLGALGYTPEQVKNQAIAWTTGSNNTPTQTSYNNNNSTAKLQTKQNKTSFPRLK